MKLAQLEAMTQSQKSRKWWTNGTRPAERCEAHVFQLLRAQDSLHSINKNKQPAERCEAHVFQLLRVQDWRGAVAAIYRARKRGVEVSKSTYLITLKTLTRFEAWDLGLRTMVMARKSGAFTGTDGVSSAFVCAAKSDDWKIALQLKKKMQRHGMELDAKQYCLIIAAAGRSQRWALALQLGSSVLASDESGGQLDEMGQQMELTPRPINAAVSACLRSARWDERAELITLTTSPRWAECEELIARLRRQGVALTASIHCIALRLRLRVDMEAGLQLFREMTQKVYMGAGNGRGIPYGREREIATPPAPFAAAPLFAADARDGAHAIANAYVTVFNVCARGALKDARDVAIQLTRELQNARDVAIQLTRELQRGDRAPCRPVSAGLAIAATALCAAAAAPDCAGEGGVAVTPQLLLAAVRALVYVDAPRDAAALVLLYEPRPAALRVPAARRAADAPRHGAARARTSAPYSEAAVACCKGGLVDLALDIHDCILESPVIPAVCIGALQPRRGMRPTPCGAALSERGAAREDAGAPSNFTLEVGPLAEGKLAGLADVAASARNLTAGLVDAVASSRIAMAAALACNGKRARIVAAFAQNAGLVDVVASARIAAALAHIAGRVDVVASARIAAALGRDGRTVARGLQLFDAVVDRALQSRQPASAKVLLFRAALSLCASAQGGSVALTPGARRERIIDARASSLLNDMRAAGLTVTWRCYNSAMFPSGQHERALSLLHDMRAADLTITARCYNSAMFACAQQKRAAERQPCVTPRCYVGARGACTQAAVPFVSQMRAQSGAKHVDKALQLFAAMQRARVPPTVHTYGVLLSGDGVACVAGAGVATHHGSIHAYTASARCTFRHRVARPRYRRAASAATRFAVPLPRLPPPACKLARSADVLVPRLCADMKSRGIPMTQTCASNAIRALACTGHWVAAQNFYRRRRGASGSARAQFRFAFGDVPRRAPRRRAARARDGSAAIRSAALALWRAAQRPRAWRHASRQSALCVNDARKAACLRARDARPLNREARRAARGGAARGDLHVDYGINPSAFTSTMMANALLDEGRPRRAANILQDIALSGKLSAQFVEQLEPLLAVKPVTTDEVVALTAQLRAVLPWAEVMGAREDAPPVTRKSSGRHAARGAQGSRDSGRGGGAGRHRSDSGRGGDGGAHAQHRRQWGDDGGGDADGGSGSAQRRDDGSASDDGGGGAADADGEFDSDKEDLFGGRDGDYGADDGGDGSSNDSETRRGGAADAASFDHDGDDELDDGWGDSDLPDGSGAQPGSRHSERSGGGSSSSSSSDDDEL
ncbi:hypothetical protein JKP88DRAFT_346424 [Tribonema minus]|uniref:Pentatricopeptide repeat-containing protein n=1 Tax=Tribonema minus TaxID=303371 RepID=A0A835ZEN5_9STRA|nr:hypothetical protein JKP88DRAFT_346424 [Tribonema minus]